MLVDAPPLLGVVLGPQTRTEEVASGATRIDRPPADRVRSEGAGKSLMGGVDIELERGERALALLHVSGHLRPGWCGNLATGLAGRGVDIVRGRATTLGDGVWNAEFELRCPRGGELPQEAVGRLLESESSRGIATPVELDRYRLERSGSRGGCLLLEVDAEDRCGFLAALLRRLAYFSLFPVELRLDTVDGAVRDRLWLRGGGDTVPKARTHTALTASLDALVASAR